jgi:hypothetical protein
MAILIQIIECPECGTEFEGSWHDESIDEEQRDEAPVQVQECPAGHSFSAEYTGWSWLSEAG